MNQGEQKKAGALAARDWMETVSNQELINLVGSGFEYGHTLTDLIEEGHNVPESNDPDFSWGFFKKAKGKLHHSMDKSNHGQRD